MVEGRSKVKYHKITTYYEPRYTQWQTIDQYEYEYEYDENGYTGWCRCVGGRMSDGKWLEFNIYTGERR